VFGVKASLMARFQRIDDAAEQAANGYDRPFFKVVHDFVLAPAA